MSDHNEDQILSATLIKVMSQNQEHDYLAEAKSLTTSNGEFWFNYAQTLRQLPSTNEMDLRENGSLAAAIYAAEKSLSLAPESLGAIAEVILSRNMMTHGLSSQLNLGLNIIHPSGKTTHALFQDTLQKLEAAVFTACEKHPDDEWFKEQLLEFRECFG